MSGQDTRARAPSRKSDLVSNPQPQHFPDCRHISEPQFPCLQNGDVDAYLTLRFYAQECEINRMLGKHSGSPH